MLSRHQGELFKIFIYQSAAEYEKKIHNDTQQANIISINIEIYNNKKEYCNH